MSSAPHRLERAIPDPNRPDLYWPAQLAVLAAIVLYVTLPEKLTPGPFWLLPALEGVLLVGLVLSRPTRRSSRVRRRAVALGLVALVSAANLFSLVMLAHFLLHGGKADGRALIFSGVGLWVTNVLIFSIWYWEVDGGGPLARAEPGSRIDFLFPQMASPEIGEKGWRPGFVDYLYVAFTNASAFSPTDAMPLTARSKLLMTVQAVISLMTTALIISRAVNILAG